MRLLAVAGSKLDSSSHVSSLRLSGNLPELAGRTGGATPGIQWIAVPLRPGQPRRLAVAAYAQAATGAVFAIFGLTAPFRGADATVLIMFVVWGALLAALGAGLYFHNGFARVLSVVYSVPAGLIAFFGIGFTGGEWYLIFPMGATVIASVLSIFAVASTANWRQLLGLDQC